MRLVVTEGLAVELAESDCVPLGLVVSVPVAHCDTEVLTEPLGEGDRDSDGVPVTHAVADTVEDGVCDSEAVTDAVKLVVTEGLGEELADSVCVPLPHAVGLPDAETLPDALCD